MREGENDGVRGIERERERERERGMGQRNREKGLEKGFASKKEAPSERH